MFPPAPKQTYIDVYIDEEPSSNTFEKDKRLQANYETEVLVYRALEMMNELIFVLHGFEYTHHQYRMCDTSHVRKKCGKCKNASYIEGECDFLVIGKNYIVIIEVKNIPYDKNEELTELIAKELTGSLAKARKQGEKVKSLVNGLLKQVYGKVDADMFPVYQFSAFPNTHRTLFQNIDVELEQIICEEDLSDFSSWWSRNVTALISNDYNSRFIVEILTAIWCTEKKQCDERKYSLGKCIMDIDEELKKGKITFLSKNRPSNPNVISVSDFEGATINNSETNIFSDIIGVVNLTKEQCDAFNKDQNLLIINGPAGSGKTIILLAKIIQFVKSAQENRAILFIFGGADNESDSINRYRETFRRADIKYDLIEAQPDNRDDTLLQKILDSKQNNQVVMFRKIGLNFKQKDMIPELLSALKGQGCEIQVFVDDFQGALHHYDYPDALVDAVMELSATNRIWIACDFTQITWFFSGYTAHGAIKTIIRRLSIPENCVTFTLNLRNSCDIAGILSKLRERTAQYFTPKTVNIMDVAFPALRPGHFIHGPRSVIYILETKFEDDDVGNAIFGIIIRNILIEQLGKLCDTSDSCGLNIGIIGDIEIFSSDIKEAIESIESPVSRNKVELCDLYSCYSAEFPAVIVITNMGMENLYLEMSRARVYCCVILYRNLADSSGPRINELLDDLKGSVKVKRLFPETIMSFSSEEDSE